MPDWMIRSDLVVTLTVVGLALAASLLLRAGWSRAIMRLLRRAFPQLPADVLNPLRDGLAWALVLGGIRYGVTSLPAVNGRPHLAALLEKGFVIAWTLLATVVLVRLLSSVAAVYAQRLGVEPDAYDQQTLVTVVRKTLTVLVLAGAALVVLRTAGIEIAPLLASGALGGLAAALALQGTLADAFAGYTIAVDRPVRVGDFVTLEGGYEGFVTEIGWRHTRLRTWANTIVVIPNAKLASAILTNQTMPESETSVYIRCGVAYSSDLEHVERVAREEGRRVQQTVGGAMADWEPLVRWKEFADSAVTFVLVLRASDYRDIYLLQSEGVKALHKRFGQEGIEIPFPIRTVVMKSPEPPSDQTGAS